jgi:outer membrane protein TolC
LLTAAVLGLGPAASAEALTGLTLDKALELALSRNERARVAQARAEAAQARVARARAFFFPELTVSGSYTRRLYEITRQVGDQEVVISRQNALSANAQLRANLFDARGFPLYRQATRDSEAARLEAADERRLLAFETADAFLNTLSAEQVAAAAKSRLEYARKQLQDARGRFEAQLVSSNDVTRAVLEEATARVEVERTEGNLSTSYLNLGYLLDAEVKPPLVGPEALAAEAAAAPGTSDELAARARERRLDVAARKLRVEALQASAQEPRMRLFPTVGLFGQYRVTNEAGLTGRPGDGFLSLDLTWPLFDGGERYAEAAERDATARAAQLEAAARDRQVAVDVEAALTVLRTAKAAAVQAQVAVEAAEKNAEEVLELYRLGLASALESADASARRFDAQVTLARERYGVLLAYLDLRAALGLDPLGREPAR